MPYVRKNRKGSRKPKMPYKRRAYRRNKPSGAFAKKVNAVIQKNVETKDASFTLNVTDFNGLVNNVADVCRIVPNIQNGTTNGTRVSDQILGQKIDFRGHMMINTVFNTTGITIPTAIPTNARLMIRAAIVSIKKYNSFDDVAGTTTWMNSILKNGAALQGLDGTLQSMYLPWNKDVITVHKEFKKFVTIPVIYEKTATAAGFAMTAVGFENSIKFISTTLKCKKLLKYDNTSFSPQNYAPFFICSYAHLDGTSADIIVSRITTSYVSTLFYEDA